MTVGWRAAALLVTVLGCGGTPGAALPDGPVAAEVVGEPDAPTDPVPEEAPEVEAAAALGGEALEPPRSDPPRVPPAAPVAAPAVARPPPSADLSFKAACAGDVCSCYGPEGPPAHCPNSAARLESPRADVRIVRVVVDPLVGASVRRDLARLTGPLRTCFEHHLRRPGPSQRVRLTLTLEVVDGRVVRRELADSADTVPDLADCVLARVRTWRLAPEVSGPVEVDVDFAQAG